jgi:hypothetical protein
VARCVHQRYGLSTVTYPNDWLLYAVDDLPVDSITADIAALGLAINFYKSVLNSTHNLVYLGLSTDTLSRTLRPTTGLSPSSSTPDDNSSNSVQTGIRPYSRLRCPILRNALAPVYSGLHTPTSDLLASLPRQNKQKTNSVALSPRANYTD